jgi:hypothetical protein
VGYQSGQILTPAEMTSWLPLSATKASSLSRTATVTKTADPDLTVPVLTSTTYEGWLVISYTAPAANDISIDFNYPAGATCSAVQIGPHNTIASAGSQATDVEFQALMLDASAPTGAMPFGGTAGGIGALIMVRLVVGSTTAGNLTVEWAQLVSGGTTTLNAGSWLTIRRVA